jgi:hypothetical protein
MTNKTFTIKSFIILLFVLLLSVALGLRVNLNHKNNIITEQSKAITPLFLLQQERKHYQELSGNYQKLVAEYNQFLNKLEKSQVEL